MRENAIVVPIDALLPATTTCRPATGECDLAELCPGDAVACPADAIYLEAAENDGTVMAGPRYAKVYQIHKTRCIFCGYCEEACPVSAIFMGKDYELAVYSKDDFIWDKQDLLVPAATTPAGK